MYCREKSADFETGDLSTSKPICKITLGSTRVDNSHKLKSMTLETTYYYRLTNNYLGANTALDVNPNGSGRLMMVAVGAFSGQYLETC